MDLSNYDLIVVGCGLSGVVISERFSLLQNKKILIIDKRDHIGGNCYDYYDQKTNILMNKYGAHLFHTNHEDVYSFINKYGKWSPWEHKVLGMIDKKHLPIPPNITTVNEIFNLDIKNKEEMDKWLSKNQVKYENITNGEEMAKSRVGEVLYEKIFKHYTYKQWKKYPNELAPEVLARIPVRNSFDDRYFSDKYQVLPEKGYTAFFQSILDKHKHNIDVKLNCDFFDIKDKITKDHLVIYTGPIDAYFADKGLPKLEYRSIDFHIERQMNTESYQPYSVVNYPSADTPYTRCVEYKHFLNQKSDHTVYVKETTTDTGEPYYPVLNERNKELYKKYQKMAEEEGENIHFLGRLASYKYFNMDQAIKNSLDYYKENFEKKTKSREYLSKNSKQGIRIFSVFSGRERYMKILSIYIDKLLDQNIIDEVHIWDFIKNENDREFINNLCKKEKYFLKKPDNSSGGPWDGYYKYYYENLNDEDILIKCDDDIVYIDVDTFEDYLSSVKNGRFYYPNIVNNDVTAYYQTKYNIHNLFDYDVDLKKWSEELQLVNDYPPPISGGFGLPEPGWFQLFEKASECHKMFLENPNRFKLNNKPLENYASRISINMFACTGFTAKKSFNKVFEADGDDEAIISGLSKVGNVINLNSTIVHFQFGPQNGKKLDTLYLNEYYKLAILSDIDPIIKIYCNKSKQVSFKNISANKCIKLVKNPNTYLICSKNGKQKIFQGVDVDTLITSCNNIETAKHLHYDTSSLTITNDTEFYFCIRGHIRNSFKTDRLKKFVKLLKMHFPNIKFILQTWQQQQCKVKNSWRNINENNSIVSKEQIENYFEDKDITKRCLIIDEESIELVGKTSGNIGIGPCPKKGWKNMWCGIYNGLKFLENDSCNKSIVSFRFDYFDIEQSKEINESKIVKFINENLNTNDIQFIEYGKFGTDNLYMGSIDKITDLIERFHFNLDDILDKHNKIYNQEFLVNFVADNICGKKSSISSNTNNVKTLRYKPKRMNLRFSLPF